MTEITEKKKAKVIPFKRRHPHEKQDFTLEYHSSIVLLRPNTKRGIAWANKNIGADNGCSQLLTKRACSARAPVLSRCSWRAEQSGAAAPGDLTGGIAALQDQVP
jgi:hypothetical protein